MKTKVVLYLMRDDLENLPPSMSQILTLCNLGYKVKIVTARTSNYIREFFSGKEVEFISLYGDENCRVSMINKVLKLVNYRKLVCKSLKNRDYDVLWVGSADTARYCRDLVEKQEVPMVLNIYELYDKNLEVIRAIKSVAQKSACVVVPEYNRAHILKVWLELKKTPIIIPNKPCFPKVDILPDTQKVVDQLKAHGKKIVLYQGWIGKDRDVSQVARALSKMENSNEYALVLLGTVTSPDTIAEIQKLFAGTIHIPFLKPPQHLFVTEMAHMGIASYDDSSLNNIFCAPNKIYEYAEKNVPVLARDIPGLSSTIEKYGAGICVDMDNTDAIMEAIRDISANHDMYVNSLSAFLNDCNVEQSIERIMLICEEKKSDE